MEYKNLTAKCLERDNPDEVVLHEVEFDRKESGAWTHHVVQIMATDPQDAINAIRTGALV
jgi:hypothetical protein